MEEFIKNFLETFNCIFSEIAQNSYFGGWIFLFMIVAGVATIISKIIEILIINPLFWLYYKLNGYIFDPEGYWLPYKTTDEVRINKYGGFGVNLDNPEVMAKFIDQLNKCHEFMEQQKARNKQE